MFGLQTLPNLEDHIILLFIIFTLCKNKVTFAFVIEKAYQALGAGLLSYVVTES